MSPRRQPQVDTYAEFDPRLQLVRALAEAPELPPAPGYRSAREAFRGVVEWCYRAGELAPVTVEGLTELVTEHARKVAYGYGGIQLEVTAAWGAAAERIRDLRPEVRRRQGYAALARLARGA